MKFETQVVHAGDRKRKGGVVPSTTPITLGTTYFYDTAEQLDRIFGHEEEGPSYARYTNPTNEALEELVTVLENGHGSLACASGMAALQIAIHAAILERNKSVVAAHAIYGATIKLLDQVIAPLGVDITYVDICDLEAVRKIVEIKKPGCVLMESVSNPLLRVGAIDEVAKLTRNAGAALIVDSTFATPMLVRPLDFGAHIVVHSATKYLAGHGDVLAGLVTCDEEHHELVRMISRINGPVLGPFESYLTMRGIKTLALRFKQQCTNAKQLACQLASHPKIERVYYTADPKHPDARVIQRLFSPGLYGAMLSFELKNANRSRIFAFMNKLRTIVPGTSLGDVHSLLLYPVMASHRDVSPKQRERMGIRENLVRLSAGIESPDDIMADLEQALSVI